MITIFLRTIFIFVILLAAVRLMGKREIGQLQPFELVVIIIIADVASVPMENINIPLLQGIIPILGLLVSQLIFSYLNIKFSFFHKIFAGKPTILIDKGIINEENLKKQRYTIEELMEQLRVSGYSHLSDVEYAILETSGEVSIISKAEKNMVTLQDLKIVPTYEGFPRIVVLEGKVDKNNMKILKKDSKWLNQKLKENKLKLEEVLLLLVSENDRIFIQKKGK